jgi:hypothetical protein
MGSGEKKPFADDLRCSIPGNNRGSRDVNVHFNETFKMVN